MPEPSSTFPIGKVDQPLVVRSAADVGQIVREQRRKLSLRQIDLAGIGNTGNRLIVDIEKGKPTVQLQKVLDVLDLLGLELTITQKTSRTP
ncbi:MAG: transcriptional regulator [Leptothrix sp. (in: b-proteobacteria)]